MTNATHPAPRTFLARQVLAVPFGGKVTTDRFAPFREVPASPTDVLAGRAFLLAGHAYTLRQLAPWTDRTAALLALRELELERKRGGE